MKRRSFLKTTLSFPFFFPLLGEGRGKSILLSNYVKHALFSQVEPSKQANIDCVSHATALGVEFVQAIQHFLRSDIWYGRIASEILHAGTVLKICPKSRGTKQVQKRRRRRRQRYSRIIDPFNSGITIKECITFIQEYGNLFRRVYGNLDLTEYNWENCKRLYRNLPDSLLEECKKHPIQTVAQITTWTEAKNAIFDLQPVVIGASVGFEKAKRDNEGFAEPSRKKWYHAWLLIGIKDHDRQGGCLISSHGKDWIEGPKSPGQPDGSIWVDKIVLHKMLSEWGDSYALSSFK